MAEESFIRKCTCGHIEAYHYSVSEPQDCMACIDLEQNCWGYIESVSEKQEKIMSIADNKLILWLRNKS